MQNTIVKFVLAFLAFSFLSSSPAMASQEQRIYQIIVKDQSTAVKIIHSYHHAILSSTERDIRLALTEKEAGVLRSQGIVLLALDDPKAVKAINEAKSKKRRTNTQSADYVSENLPAFNGISGYACYPTVEETYEMAEQLSQEHPTLATWKTIGESWRKSNGEEGFDLKVLVLSNKEKAADKPKLLIQSAMHAREYTTAALTLEFAGYLLSNYQSDAEANWILNEREVHILFMMNPDGRKEAEKGILWRKNANSNYCPEEPQKIGVDLNRNFSFKWNTTPNGSSGDACATNFRGSVAASEPETQAIEAYIESIFDDFRGPNDADAAPPETRGLHLDIHSYGGLVLWPWGGEEAMAPNGVGLQTLGRKLAAFTNYRPFQAVGMYPTDGTIDDFVYGELGVPSLTYELGTSFFESCATYQQQILPTNIQSFIYAAKVADLPYVKPAGPDLIDVRLQGAGSQAVPAGTEIRLAAVASDNFYNYLPDESGDALEKTQAIASVDFSVVRLSDSETVLEGAMLAKDGQFDSATEAVEAELETVEFLSGEYDVLLATKDADGQQGVISAVRLKIDSAAPVVNNEAPSPVFTEQCENFVCIFDASASLDDTGIVSYIWEIDGSTVLYGKQVSFQYNVTKTYDVKLTVVDEHGVAVSTAKRLNLIGNSAPVAEFSYSCDEFDCQFDASGSRDPDGTIKYYIWYVDGIEMSEWQVQISHQFKTEGKHTVELVVVDDRGVYNVAKKTIDVVERPSSGGSMTLWFSLFVTLMLAIRRYSVIVNPDFRNFRGN